MKPLTKYIEEQIRLGNFDFLEGSDLNVQNLGQFKNNEGQTALHIVIQSGHLGKLTGPILASDLLAVQGENQFSALNCAAANGALKHLDHGAPFEMLVRDKTLAGRSAFDNAVLADDLGHITNLTPDNLATVNWETLFWAAATWHNINGMRNAVKMGNLVKTFQTFLARLAMTQVKLKFQKKITGRDVIDDPVFLHGRAQCEAMWCGEQAFSEFLKKLIWSTDWDPRIIIPGVVVAELL